MSEAFLLRAANQGHPKAANQLALLAAHAGSHSTAREWLTKAAIAGSRAAMSNLALYLERGTEV